MIHIIPSTKGSQDISLCRRLQERKNGIPTSCQQSDMSQKTMYTGVLTLHIEWSLQDQNSE